MKKFPFQTPTTHENQSSSNPSLLTAGLPSGSIMTSRLIQPSKQNYHLNQNRATDTQPISFNSQKSDTSPSITLSHRTTSDVYLNLTRKDIDDLMTALHTLAEHVHNDMDENKSHPLTILHSKSSSEVNRPFHDYPSRYSIRNRQRSLSSDYWFDDHEDTVNRYYRNLVKEFQHQFYTMKCKQERRLIRQLQYYQNHFHHQHSSSYPSYRSNVILQTSTYGSTVAPPKQISPSSRPNLPSLKSLSSYILDQLIYIDRNEPESNLQMLPQHAHTLQIIQNTHTTSLLSNDSLNTKEIRCTASKPCHMHKSGIGDQISSNKIDVATQWSFQILTPKSTSSSSNHQEHTNSSILTELSQSRTTIATNNSAVPTPIHSFMNTSTLKSDQCPSSLNEHELTKSETERFLTSLNLPTCQCLNAKLPTKKTNDTTDDDDDDVSMTSLNRKKIKRTTMKFAPKRSRPHPSRAPKTNPPTKRFRPSHPSPSNNRLMTLIQSLRTADLQEDSSFDFFDVDTTFSDVYDRFFSDTIISEK